MNGKKGSVQLSMSFLITIIISITLLVGGIALIKNFYTSAVETQQKLDERTQQRLAELLNEGQQLAIPFSQQTIERGEGYVFGLGILNIGDEASFVVEVTVSTIFDDANKELPTAAVDIITPTSWLLYDSTPQLIGKNEQRVVSILAEIPKDAPSGLYNFNVKVVNTVTQQPYDKIQKIRITVP
ncbi:MAG TPA: hypothetical protein VJK72_01825 [Candidatus Nanoarchaeia archaeon]|nr:hypothetical protein [Candidatus Nanoarchaeia archaeon]